MIVKDEINLVPTKFKDLRIGDVYKLKGREGTFMKITHIYLKTNKSENKYMWNCVCLDDGFLDYTYDGTEVFKLKAELRVWN